MAADKQVNIMEMKETWPCSKPLGSCMVDSAFHFCEVDKMSTWNFWELGGKIKLPPRSSSSFESVELHP